MRRTKLDRMDCSIAKALDIVGDPWTMLILRDALLGVTRFDAFSTRLGIPRATLSARLDHLCERGVLDQRRYRERPERMEYVLTPMGRALRPVVVTLMQWGDQWVRVDDPPTTIIDEDGVDGRARVLVDRGRGIPLEDLRLRARGPVTAGLERPTDAML